MVLYHTNGRVVEAHEHYLEQQARKEAEDRYIDQIDIYNNRNAEASTANVQIIIDDQEYYTLYSERAGEAEKLKAFKQDAPIFISRTVDRTTLMTCSTFAQEHFTYNPGDTELHLPVCYPRMHLFGAGKQEADENNQIFGHDVLVNGTSLVKKLDDQMAFIRPEEIEKYIVPWLERVQEQFEKAKTPRIEACEGSQVHAGDMPPPPKWTKLARSLVGPSSPTSVHADRPIAMDIPDALVDKIHIYNAMLQLGLPKFVQLPLIDALVLQMYQTKLTACHLDTLEHTIGRLYSKGVAVLDPVLNHFIGTYSFRGLEDRENPKPPAENDTESPEKASTESYEDFDFQAAKRGYLHFVDIPAYRTDYPLDTHLLPPELPVLGHSIKHWSSVRRNQSTAAAHTGFPLNIGKHKKFIRRNSTGAIDVNDYYEEETNRLAHQEYYWKHRPGQGNSLSSSTNEDEA